MYGNSKACSVVPVPDLVRPDASGLAGRLLSADPVAPGALD